MTGQELIDEGYTEGKKSFEWYAAQIGAQFNFETVLKAMVATEWTWFMGKDKNGNDQYGIPSLETIKNHAAIILREAYEKQKHVSTGGFSAGFDDDIMYLTFTIEEASV